MRRSGAASTLAVIAATTLFVLGQAALASGSNANSPLGINLLQVSYFSAEQPFLNIFKTTGVSQATPDGWITHSDSTWDTHEQAYLQLDRDGYPKTLKASAVDPNSPQLFTSVGVVLFRDLPRANAGTGLRYRQGQYVVLYDGQGTLRYGFDARLVTSSPGRDVISATPTEAGIDLRITSTDPRNTGNYLRNIRVVKAEDEHLLRAGQVFRPDYLRLLGGFRIIRGMQWLNVHGKGGALRDWSSRPLLTDAGWGSDNGTPIEVLLKLCAEVDADCWLNVPHRASDDYIAQMATLAHNALGSEQRVYIEFSNEVWNSAFDPYNYAVAQGRAAWPAAGATPYDYNRNWYGMRTAQMCDIWKSQWGTDAARVVCVLGAQAANTDTAVQSLNCPLWRGAGHAPCVNHNITAVAIAPYFGDAVPPGWTSQPDGGLASLFAAMTTQNDPSVPRGGWLGEISRFESAYRAALAPYRLELIGYEGGQSFVGHPRYQNGSAIVNLYVAANRDARMGVAYAAALRNWRENGGHAWVLFGDMYAPSQYGEWGALESFQDTIDPPDKAPPKWRALQNFISNNPCWWPACADVATVPARQPSP